MMQYIEAAAQIATAIAVVLVMLSQRRTRVDVNAIGNRLIDLRDLDHIRRASCASSIAGLHDKLDAALARMPKSRAKRTGNEVEPS